MSEGEVVRIAQTCIVTALKLSLPVLLFGLVAGVLVSLFQAATQIQEFTLTFVPKLLAMVVAVVIFGPWMLATAVNFMVNILTRVHPIAPG
ncbi:MAG TPA: flagellar biosynthesis protein FliQ [Chthonomonadales bacterium]|nr:flagellar biosynthesis protein FliQ [Chthonomonadales bacterium]